MNVMVAYTLFYILSLLFDKTVKELDTSELQTLAPVALAIELKFTFLLLTTTQ